MGWVWPHLGSPSGPLGQLVSPMVFGSAWVWSLVGVGVVYLLESLAVVSGLLSFCVAPETDGCGRADIRTHTQGGCGYVYGQND